jgi:hypothetical protein
MPLLGFPFGNNNSEATENDNSEAIKAFETALEEQDPTTLLALVAETPSILQCAGSNEISLFEVSLQPSTALAILATIISFALQQADLKIKQEEFNRVFLLTLSNEEMAKEEQTLRLQQLTRFKASTVKFLKTKTRRTPSRTHLGLILLPNTDTKIQALIIGFVLSYNEHCKKKSAIKIDSTEFYEAFDLTAAQVQKKTEKYTAKLQQLLRLKDVAIKHLTQACPTTGLTYLMVLFYFPGRTRRLETDHLILKTCLENLPEEERMQAITSRYDKTLDHIMGQEGTEEIPCIRIKTLLHLFAQQNDEKGFKLLKSLFNTENLRKLILAENKYGHSALAHVLLCRQYRMAQLYFDSLSADEKRKALMQDCFDLFCLAIKEYNERGVEFFIRNLSKMELGVILRRTSKNNTKPPMQLLALYNRPTLLIRCLSALTAMQSKAITNELFTLFFVHCVQNNKFTIFEIFVDRVNKDQVREQLIKDSATGSLLQQAIRARRKEVLKKAVSCFESRELVTILGSTSTELQDLAEILTHERPELKVFVLLQAAFQSMIKPMTVGSIDRDSTGVVCVELAESYNKPAHAGHLARTLITGEYLAPEFRVNPDFKSALQQATALISAHPECKKVATALLKNYLQEENNFYSNLVLQKLNEAPAPAAMTTAATHEQAQVDIDRLFAELNGLSITAAADQRIFLRDGEDDDNFSITAEDGEEALTVVTTQRIDGEEEAFAQEAATISPAMATPAVRLSPTGNLSTCASIMFQPASPAKIAAGINKQVHAATEAARVAAAGT